MDATQPRSPSLGDCVIDPAAVDWAEEDEATLAAACLAGLEPAIVEAHRRGLPFAPGDIPSI